MADVDPLCPVCGGATAHECDVVGAFSGGTFHIRRCGTCRFAFVENPMTNFDEIYSEDYYRGRGADPLVDYIDELDHPETTIRQYEWRGVMARVKDLAPVSSSTRWLDFGCGMGGLVSYLRRQGLNGARGFEQGWCTEHLQRRGIPILSEEDLDQEAESFDVVTAIEVIEHALDPMAELRRLRQLLKPGGLLFLTTGNARPHAGRLDRWPYVVPEVHVSFFEPDTLALAMRGAGFEPAFAGFGPGWTDIIRFKVLKNLKRRRISPLERVVPWGLAARVVDRRVGTTGHPVGRVHSGVADGPR